MSSAKKNQQDYEALLKDYERAQAQFTRTQLSEKAAKKNLKKAAKGDASKTEVEILRLELEIAKSKRKGRKAGAAIAKTLMKQWIKANAKQKKSYKLTIREEVPAPIMEIAEVVTIIEAVKPKRPYTRRPKTEEIASEARAIESTPEIEEGKAGMSVAMEAAEATRDITEAEEEEKKSRLSRRSSAEVKAAKEAAQAALRERGDDFSIIEGVGPAVTAFLHNIGIRTFDALAAADAADIKAQLKAKRNNIADPTTWPQQAQLVVNNDWEALKELQESLKRPR